MSIIEDKFLDYLCPIHFNAMPQYLQKCILNNVNKIENIYVYTIYI